MSAEKSSKKGFAILFVGVMIGIGVGIATCVTMMAHPPSATGSAKKEAVTAKAPSQPLPSLYPPPPQTASLTPNYEPEATPQIQQAYQQAAPVYQQASAPVYPQGVYQQPPAPTGLAIQSQDGSLLIPGVNAYETHTQVAGVPTTYDTTPLTISAGNINPNWTVGRNGLLQNPCVDPPSAHGRATGPY